MNSEEKDYKLYVPINVKTRLEFFNGFGISELITTAIMAGCFLPISFIVYKIKGSFLIPIIIEVLQYIFATGALDINDIILNVISGIIGVTAYAIIHKIKQR